MLPPFVSQTFELESWKFKELLGFQVLESQREVTMRWWWVLWYVINLGYNAQLFKEVLLLGFLEDPL